MVFENGILKGFEPSFKSIAKDCDRYFDALYDLSEKDEIKAGDIINLSGPGYLWIKFQYIEKGMLDIVEADLRQSELSNDTFGHLYENTVLTLNRFLEMSEHKRVVSFYHDAIKHRLRILKFESNSGGKTPQARSEKLKWLKHNLPPTQKMITDYETLLNGLNHTDPELAKFKNMVQELRAVL